MVLRGCIRECLGAVCGRMSHTFLRSSASEIPSPRRSFALLALLLTLCMTGLTGCSLFESSKDKDDKPPKRQEHNYRDAVEQRVFYNGWFER